MKRQYYYMMDGQVKGPLDEDSIAIAINAGRLKQNVMVSRGGDSPWEPFLDPKNLTQHQYSEPSPSTFTHKINLLEGFLFYSGKTLSVLVTITYFVTLLLLMADDDLLDDIGFWPYTLTSLFTIILGCLLMAIGRIVTYLRIITERE